jgi:hypothetical protein
MTIMAVPSTIRRGVGLVWWLSVGIGAAVVIVRAFVQ